MLTHASVLSRECMIAHNPSAHAVLKLYNCLPVTATAMRVGEQETQNDGEEVKEEE